jgi:hypothetical protein
MIRLSYAETQSDGDIVFRVNGATATNGDPVDGYAYCDNSNSLKCWPLLLTALASQREVKAFFNQTKGGSGTEKDPWIVTALRIH